MGQDSAISWTDHSFAPWLGCSHAGPGCAHCYAEALDKRGGGAHWGPGQARRRTVAANWQQPRRWAKAACIAGAPARVFANHLGDVFDNEVPDEWRADFWALVRETPALEWLLLTKRIGNARRMLPADWGAGGYPNCRLGITVCNQEEADRDVPKLLATPAASRFLSVEPILGPVDIQQYLISPDGFVCHRGGGEPYHVDDGGLGLDWVIVGGESGGQRRPCQVAWFTALAEQTQAWGWPLFVKQDAALHPGQQGRLPADLWALKQCPPPLPCHRLATPHQAPALLL